MTDDIATLQQRLAGARLAITVLRDALTQARATITELRGRLAEPNPTKGVAA